MMIENRQLRRLSQAYFGGRYVSKRFVDATAIAASALLELRTVETLAPFGKPRPKSHDAITVIRVAPSRKIKAKRLAPMADHRNIMQRQDKRAREAARASERPFSKWYPPGHPKRPRDPLDLSHKEQMKLFIDLMDFPEVIGLMDEHLVRIRDRIEALTEYRNALVKMEQTGFRRGR